MISLFRLRTQFSVKFGKYYTEFWTKNLNIIQGLVDIGPDS
jgi:hypothetical protein